LIPLLITDCTPPDTIAQFAYIDWRACSDEAYGDILDSCLEKEEARKRDEKKALERKQREEEEKATREREEQEQLIKQKEEAEKKLREEQERKKKKSLKEESWKIQKSPKPSPALLMAWNSY
jgi:hypothetical protein